jgi:two-component system nitrogen regulation response regulator GlnG
MANDIDFSDTTIAAGPRQVRSGPQGVDALVPRLTVLHHADPSRVGAFCDIGGPGLNSAVDISRASPLFVQVNEALEIPLADPHLSRTPSLRLRAEGELCVVELGTGGGPVRVDGREFRGSKALGSAALDRGVVINLCERVVLLLHRAPAGVAAPREDFGLLGASHAISKSHAAIRKVADLDVPVLIRGESGTGKELTARALHDSSGRAAGPFVAVNMGAVSVSTASSELFGHRKGAFTGASSDRRGLFAQAHGGTLFLDEVGEAPIEIQVMLLRCLEDGLIQAVGSDKAEAVDVRVIAATDRDLEAAVEEGSFRAPLLYRLAGFQIPLPPLRDRLEDLGLLLHTFLSRELTSLGEGEDALNRPVRDDLWLKAALVEKFALFDWPGNIRQLANVARQLVISSRGDASSSLPESLVNLLLTPSDSQPHDGEALPAAITNPNVKLRPEDIDESMLLDALREEGWRIAATSRRLGISRTSLYGLMAKSSKIKKARDLTSDEVSEAIEAAAGNVGEAAARLEVSERGLRLRMAELGPPS